MYRSERGQVVQLVIYRYGGKGAMHSFFYYWKLQQKQEAFLHFFFLQHCTYILRRLVSNTYTDICCMLLCKSGQQQRRRGSIKRREAKLLNPLSTPFDFFSIVSKCETYRLFHCAMEKIFLHTLLPILQSKGQA